MQRITESYLKPRYTLILSWNIKIAFLFLCNKTELIQKDRSYQMRDHLCFKRLFSLFLFVFIIIKTNRNKGKQTFMERMITHINEISLYILHKQKLYFLKQMLSFTHCFDQL